MITYGTILSELPEFLVNDSLTSRLSNWTEWTLRDLTSSYEWWWNQAVGSITTVDETAQYLLSHRVDGRKVKWLGNTDNKTQHLTLVNLQDIYKRDSTPTDTGTPTEFAFVDQVEVTLINTIAAVGSIVSTSAADTMNSVWTGLVDSIERVEVIPLTGTVAATGSLVWDIGSVTSVVIASASAGVVTASVSTEVVVTLSPGMLRKQCPRVQLYRVPGSALTIPYIYHKNVLKPSNNGDIIDIDDSALPVLLKGIMYWGYRNNGDLDFAQQIRAEYKDDKEELISLSEKDGAKKLRKKFENSGVVYNYTLPTYINGTAP